MADTAVMNDLVSQLADAAIQRVNERRVAPAATYRVQFHAGWTFRDAAAIVPYLKMLGISHVYASPYVRAKTGSVHGYDVCDYNQFNPELGGEEGYREFLQSLERSGISQILDFVPNHMAASHENPWWRDVLQNGPNSPYAGFFDIDWHPVQDELQNKVLFPILGAQYGEVLENGDLKIEHEDGGFHFRYFNNVLPFGPNTLLPLLTHRLRELETALGTDSEDFNEYQSILTAIEHLPAATATSSKAIHETQREKEVIKRRLRELETRAPAIAGFLAGNIAEFNGQPGQPHSFDPLDQLLQLQSYRLCHWRAASDEVNYRRFFDINELAALCMEKPEVFHAAHDLVGRLLARGEVTGLRIDHVDGLYSPEEYLWRLQWTYLAHLMQLEFEHQTPEPTDAAVLEERSALWLTSGPEALRQACRRLGIREPGENDMLAVFGKEVSQRLNEEAIYVDESDTQSKPAEVRPLRGRLPLFVAVEKILGPDEPLPETWPVAGTTGYDFTNQLNGVFIHPAGMAALTKQYMRFTHDRRSFAEIAWECKRLIVRFSMASELQMLAHRLNRISEQHRRTRDFTLNALRHALREVLSCFPVYRTYPQPGGVSDRDRRFVNRAVERAKRQSPTEDPAAFDFIRDVLLLRHPAGLSEEAIREREDFACRFQQVTSPVMAKGVEDTAFYVYFPLVSANEVGADPAHAVTRVESFHQQNLERQSQQLHSLLATSTHDTKRSEDVRARINVLSEVPRLWRDTASRFSRLTRRWRKDLDGSPAPSRSDEYLFYQSLVGIWPSEPPNDSARQALIERLQNYMDKATHEAKQRTSWINPHVEYDQAVRQFVADCLTPSKANRFLPEFTAFHRKIVDAGQYAALSQVVLKMMSPGSPDIYQGQEIWDYSLVDPDNRRPVNFARRTQLLEQMQAELAQGRERQAVLAEELGRASGDDRLKLFVTWRLLSVRQACRSLFETGTYVPLSVTGHAAEHVVAFAWRGDATEAEGTQETLLVVAPRWLARLGEGAKGDASQETAPIGERAWGDTSIVIPTPAPTQLFNSLTGEVLEVTSPVVRVADLLSRFPVAVMTSRSKA
jgi:(1->4)-alpha-D-glucan 1-alpha-D-glucosylmutase